MGLLNNLRWVSGDVKSSMVVIPSALWIELKFSFSAAIALRILGSKTVRPSLATKANRISPFDGKVRPISSNSFRYGSLFVRSALSELLNVVLKIPDPNRQVKIAARTNKVILFKTAASATFSDDKNFRESKFKGLILFRV